MFLLSCFCHVHCKMSVMTKPDNWLKVGLETDQYCYIDDINEHLIWISTEFCRFANADALKCIIQSNSRSVSVASLVAHLLCTVDIDPYHNLASNKLPLIITRSHVDFQKLFDGLYVSQDKENKTTVTFSSAVCCSGLLALTCSSAFVKDQWCHSSVWRWSHITELHF